MMAQLGENVTTAEIYYAEDEDRSIMDPLKLLENNSHTKVGTIILPGKHSSLVKMDPENPEYQKALGIVRKCAELFFRKSGISLKTDEVIVQGTMKAVQSGRSPRLTRTTTSHTIASLIQNGLISQTSESVKESRSHNQLSTNPAKLASDKTKQFFQEGGTSPRIEKWLEHNRSDQSENQSFRVSC